jgi:endo-1,4-beta-xylanase
MKIDDEVFVIRRPFDSVVAIAIACAIAACGSDRAPEAPASPSAPPSTPTDSLKNAGTSLGKLVGTAVQSGLLSQAQYNAVASREFNYLTAEYQMKWNVIEPNQGGRDFGPGDAIAAYAASQGMRIKGHTLLWHGATPSWVNALPADDLRSAVEQHIRAVLSHYRGRIHAWDVVNEAVADSGASLRDTVFRQKLGDRYIADAFRIAREADPSALLFYNDYGGEGTNAKADRIYTLLQDLLANGVPIDGVGLQMHISATGRPSDPAIAANMRRLAGLGLIVHISEMDVRVNDSVGTDQARLEAQRAAYHDVVRVCVMEPRCEAITFWGFTDAHTWLTGDRPLLFDAAYQPKPAYTGVLEALRGR